jgi:hypothetical protein
MERKFVVDAEPVVILLREEMLMLRVIASALAEMDGEVILEDRTQIRVKDALAECLALAAPLGAVDVFSLPAGYSFDVMRAMERPGPGILIVATRCDHKLPRRSALVRLTREHYDRGSPWPSQLPVCWRGRETLRLMRGEYDKVPWTRNGVEPIPGHFVHMSKDASGMVAYTENDAKGRKDVQTRMKPGRYLQKFHPELSAGCIERYCRSIVGGRTVRFAVTPAEIRDVYERGPQSCMAHGAGRWGLCGKDGELVHPVEAYGNSDLQLAYIAIENKISARCLVWPEKKLYGRIYGDARIGDLLSIAGYRVGSFHGASIRKLRVQNGRVAVPYLDNPARYVTPHPDSEGKLLISSDSGTETTERAWLSAELCDEGDEESVCERCERLCDRDDVQLVYSASEGGCRTTSGYWCVSCIDDQGAYCDYSGDHFDDETEMIEIECPATNNTVSFAPTNRAMRSLGLYYCDGYEARVLTDAWGPVRGCGHPTIANGMTYSQRWINEHGVWVNGTLCARDDVGDRLPVLLTGEGVSL